MCLIIIYMFMYMFACGAQLPTDSRQPRPHREAPHSSQTVSVTQSHTDTLTQLSLTRDSRVRSRSVDTLLWGLSWGLVPRPDKKNTHLARATQITKRALKLL